LGEEEWSKGMRGISLALTLAVLVSSQVARADQLKGQVSTSAIDEGPEGGMINPPAEALMPSQDQVSTDMSNLPGLSVGLSESVNRLSATPNVSINIVQLRSNSPQLDAIIAARMDHRRRLLSGDAQKQLGCIGICYEAITGRVIRVLPGSDLYGSVFPGDQLIAEDGLSPLEGWQRGQNFGEPGSLTKITVIGENGQQTIACHRKPISELMPGLENALNWASLNRTNQ
jgi:hypothetical protein